MKEVVKCLSKMTYPKYIISGVKSREIKKPKIFHNFEIHEEISTVFGW